ncbi:MAG TPA: outer membrane beta-barrel protein [Ferruginibacter sp.]|nr:outer membrane beta-barrel protein [Ferruginibacter sp.]
METKNNNIENFEKFLREKTDEFRMYPSKRVWYSIYNDMHPGNRLPSISMTVVLIGFLFLIGFLNTTETAKENNIPKQDIASSGNVVVASNTLPEKNTAGYSTTETGSQLSSNNRVNLVNSSGESNPTVAGNSSEGLHRTTQPKTAASGTSTTAIAGRTSLTITNAIAEDATNNPVAEITTDNTVVLNAENNTAAFEPATGNPSFNNSGAALSPAGNDITVTTSNFNDENILAEKSSSIAVVNVQSIDLETTAGKDIPGGLNADKEVNATSSGTPNTDKQLAAAESVKNKNQITWKEKAWMDDFVLHNKPVARKWAGRAGLQAYITPSVVYRRIRNNAIDKQLAGTNSNFNNFNANDFVKHKPSFGIETGLSIQYDISRRIRIKAGAQFNYTRYNAFAYETNHPVAATLTMNADDNIMTYEAFRTSNYTNIYGNYSTKLHNETYQLSIPVGADYKLANISDNVSWYAGATIQPTIVLFAKSFVLSTDRRSYIQDPTLLNRLNMNAGFETYFSFDKGGYSLQLGPQYRMQLFSTNTKMYSLEERLQNFGVKLGLTKKL